MEVPPEAWEKAGVGRGLANGDEIDWPVHGLRHPPEGDTSGWYIWTGDLTDDADFFVPMHPVHLLDRVSGLAQELSAPPGSRFLIAPDYRDVWHDPTLLYVAPQASTDPPPRVQIRRLSAEEYHATMKPNPRRIGPDERPPFDFWDYFDELPPAEWQGHDFSRGTVSYAYVMQDGRWQHVLVESEDENVNLALVLDLSNGQVYGHHLLDLNREYGLDDTSE